MDVTMMDFFCDSDDGVKSQNSNLKEEVQQTNDRYVASNDEISKMYNLMGLLNVDTSKMIFTLII